MTLRTDHIVDGTHTSSVSTAVPAEVIALGSLDLSRVSAADCDSVVVLADDTVRALVELVSRLKVYAVVGALTV
jgi:hypothetical protein